MAMADLFRDSFRALPVVEFDVGNAAGAAAPADPIGADPAAAAAEAAGPIGADPAVADVMSNVFRAFKALPSARFGNRTEAVENARLARTIGTNVEPLKAHPPVFQPLLKGVAC